jgi:hypothetical protein
VQTLKIKMNTWLLEFHKNSVFLALDSTVMIACLVPNLTYSIVDMPRYMEKTQYFPVAADIFMIQ